MAISVFTRQPEETNPINTDKKLLFISYESSNLDKVRHIKKFLSNHPVFEPLVVADRPRANDALSELVKEGIEKSYCIIPILSPESFKTQWVNQEIGYALGVNKPIKPIVESGILKDLKGFVHSQNQCPYMYTFRPLPYKSSENKSFMICFKHLIKDLEEVANKSKSEIIKEANNSILPLNRNFLLPLREPIGKIIRTGEVCPESGMWKTKKLPPTSTMPFTKGVRMPHYEGNAILWKLLSYL